MTLAKIAADPMNDQRLVLQNNRLSVTVDTALGARIAAFSCRGKNALVTSGPQTGSTFWPSPQEAWGWPPPAALDVMPYRVIETGNALALLSEPCSQTRLQVGKKITLLHDRMRVIYSMRNLADSPQWWAPWEISRVAGGVTFYASANGPAPISTGPALHENGVVWQEYAPQSQQSHEKLFGHNSEGWLANAHNGLLLVKRFAPIGKDAQSAPGEAEVEIYAHGDVANPYVEVEQQGAYQSMAPGEQVRWQVDWLLTELPVDTEYLAGNSALVAQVRRMLKLRG